MDTKVTQLTSLPEPCCDWVAFTFGLGSVDDAADLKMPVIKVARWPLMFATTAWVVVSDVS